MSWRSSPFSFPNVIANPNMRASLNVQTDSSTFLNFSKGWFPTSGTALTGSNTDANGYPTTAVSASGQINLKPGYYGQYVWKFTGTATMQFIGQDAIVYSGGTNCGLGSSSGVITGNFSILASGGANPRVVFKFGTLVTAISGGGGSLVTITTASLNFGTGVSTGTQVTFNQGCSSNLINGPNADGSWTVTNVSGTQFTLNNSTGVTSPTITTGGVVGTNTEAVFGVPFAALGWINSGTFSGVTGLVVCLAANENDITNGLIWDPAFVADVQSLMGTSTARPPGWLRFMDFSGVQGNWDQDFNQRLLTSQQCWTNNQLPRPNYYVSGGLSHGAGSGAFSEVYTCAPPSASPGSGAPVDGEVIQGAASATNTGGTPALTMTGRTGTWPIIGTQQSWFLNNTAGVSAGLSVQVTFTASWLNGGSAYTFSYTTVSGDSNQSTFGINVTNALSGDSTLATAKFVFTYDDLDKRVVIICPTALADAVNGMVRVSYSGPAALTLNTLPASTMSTGVNTLVFSSLMGAFIYTGSTPTYAPPFEAIVELCNRTNNNCWYTWQIYTQRAYITALANFFAQSQASGGLAPNLKFGGEVGNEMWNFGLQPWGRAQCYGIALGLFTGTYGANAGPYSWTALKTVEYSGLSKTAWTGSGRAASNHYTLMMTQTVDSNIGGNWESTSLKGQYLTTSITSYANFGGANFGSTSTSHNTSGNYPGDITDAIGFAPYWGSHWMSGAANFGNSVNGTVAENAPMLQASLDFANGNTVTAFTSMYNQFANITVRSSGTSGEFSLGSDYTTLFNTLEGTAGQFDSARRGRGQTVLGIMHYEGGPQFGCAANFNTGTNSVDCLAADIASADITALANQITSQGWNVSAYTVSGTNNATEAATQILTLIQGWKYDTTHTAVAASTNSYKNFIVTYYYQQLQNISGGNREARGSQYGVWGNQWGFYYSTWLNGAASAYKNRDAFVSWNT